MESGAAVWHKYVPVGPQAHETELYGIDANDGNAVVQVVIVPGNPGSALFYIPFLQLVHAHLEGRADVVVFSHLAHDLKSSHSALLVSLEDQIQHKVNVFKDIILLKGRAPAVILGHSIGGYMLLHALPHLQDIANASSTKILKVIGMFPFLEADFSLARVKSLHKISQYYEALGMLGGLLSWLPRCMTSAIFRSLAKDSLDQHAVNTCCTLLTRATLRQYFYLASCYVVKKPFNWDLISARGPLLVMFACPNDTWMPKSLYHFIRDAFPHTDVRWEEEMAHAFIVSDKRCRAAARLVADVVASVTATAAVCDQ